MVDYQFGKGVETMIGENKANDFKILKYALIKEFFQAFDELKICGIPIAQCMIGQYNQYIRSFISTKLSDKQLIDSFKVKYGFHDMKSIYQSLMDYKIREVPLERNRDNIMMSSQYLQFATDQFKDYNVYLYSSGALQLEVARPNMHVFSLKDEVIKQKKVERAASIAQIEEKAKKIIQQYNDHVIFGTIEFNEWFHRYLLYTILRIVSFDSFVRLVRPAVIIDPAEAGIFGTILGLLAQKYKIPFINMPVLLINDRAILPTRASHYLVWGSIQKRWLMDRGIEAFKISTVGNIGYWYSRQTCAQMSKELLFNKLGIPLSSKIVVFTTQPFPEANVTILSWLLELVPDDYVVIIKKHKADSNTYSMDLNQNHLLICPSDIDFLSLLQHTHVMLTISSNTALEGALFNIPLIILQPKMPYHFELNYDDSNAHLVQGDAGIPVYNAKDLQRVLRELMSQNSAREEAVNKIKTYITKVLYSIDKPHILARGAIINIIGESFQ